MNILVLGSGGREHALSWKLAQSKRVTNLFIAPGNPGTASLGTNVNMGVNDFEAIDSFVEEKAIDMVVIGPEDPLVNGLTNFLRKRPGRAKLAIVGPSAEGAQLEGSKDFAKAFMAKHNIPTAKYQTFTADTLEAGYSFLESLEAPYVLKADGLAAGKGVLILSSLDEAKTELKNMLVDSKFGTASSRVVIEEFLDGIEFSVFVLTDGEGYVILPEAKDYKRIGEGDAGLNTGGMGAVSPVPFVNKAMMDKVRQRIIEPTVKGLAKDNLEFQGFIFLGLINVNGNPMVIEYNVRMGDPETEVVMPRIKSDLVELFEKMNTKQLAGEHVEFDSRAASTVMVVSGGYPESYPKGKEIGGVENVEDALVFHAGTLLQDGKLVTNGGRVMAFTGTGQTKEKALQQSYSAIQKVCFDGIYFRKDIGFDL